MTKRLKKEESLQVSNLKPYTNFTFTIQAKTIELGERANFTAKTSEGGKYEIFFCVPRRTPFLEGIFLVIRAIFHGHGQRPSSILCSYLYLVLCLNTYSPMEDFGVNSFSGS